MPAYPRERDWDALLKVSRTEKQRETVRNVRDHGFKETAKIMKRSERPIYDMINRLEELAITRGYSDEADREAKAPEGYFVKGKSTYFDRDGKIRGQWVKTQVDQDKRLQLITNIVEHICQDVTPLDALPPPVEVEDDLCNVYTMTDCHMGMLAWDKEAGKDWDLKIGEKVLTGCFASMVDKAPKAKTAVVAQLGDFLHYDSLIPLTPTSGHILDADSRAEKMVTIAVDVLIRLVKMALAKHEEVHVLMAEGNHDMYGSIYLRVLFRKLFENEPRVKLIYSANPYYTMQFGKVMLCWHHGHKKGLDPSTALMFAERNSKMFGETEHRYIHFGDKHHWAGKEVAGFYLEQHPSLATADAYAARGGWDSRQRAEAITYHREYGQAARVTVTPAMIGL